VGDGPSLPDGQMRTTAGYVRRAGRAGNGVGTLRWREGTARWELRFQVDGVRRTEHFSVARWGSREKAEAEAKRRRRILSGQAAAGLLVLTRDVPLDKFVDRFLDRQAHLEEATKREYRSRLAHVLRLLPSKGVHVLDDGDRVAWFFNQLRAEGYSTKLIAHVRHVLGLLIDLAVVQGYLRHNVIRTERIKTPTVDPRDYRLFRADEIRAMLGAEAVDGGRLQAVIALMALGGLRPGEAIGLSWADVEGEWLRVRTSGRRATTKTRAGRRRIKLPQRVLDGLASWRSAGPCDGDYVFPGLTVKRVDVEFPRLQHRLGIEPAGRPYDLRHTAITHAIAYAQVTAGVSIADVARWAGHSRNSTTLDTYCHVLDSSPGLADVMVTAYGADLAELPGVAEEVGPAASAAG
jgi:integrase